MPSKIDLCSMALLKLGEKPITDLNNDSASAQLANTLYDTTLDALLSAYPWRFATQHIIIEKNQDGEFIVPKNVLRILRCSGRVYGNKIVSNENNAKLVAVMRIPVEEYPSYFISLAATKLAMEFCIPLTGNQQTLRILISLYESEFQNAKFIDSTTSANSSIEQFSLINARF